MIKLNEEVAFACGHHREVYRHPNKPERCLKLMTEDWEECKRSLRASPFLRAIPFYNLFRPRWYYHENEGELHFSEVLRRRVGPAAWDFVSQAYGFVESDLGEVLEVDLITDHDGEISLSLKEYAWKYGITDPCREALDIFWKQLDEEWVFIQGQPDNISVRQMADGRCQMVAIDGYTYYQVIPLSKWFRREQRRTLQKRRRSQERALQTILKQRENGEDITKEGMLLNQ